MSRHSTHSCRLPAGSGVTPPGVPSAWAVGCRPPPPRPAVWGGGEPITAGTSLPPPLVSLRLGSCLGPQRHLPAEQGGAGESSLKAPVSSALGRAWYPGEVGVTWSVGTMLTLN